MKYLRSCLGAFFLSCAAALLATVFGGVQGLIHDPQHRPVNGAEIRLRAAHSDWSTSVTSDSAGEFQFTAVPVGEYIVSVSVAGFAPQEQHVLVTSDALARIHLQLALPQVTQSVEVTAASQQLTPESSPATTMVNREEIAQTPGADRSNSLAMITDYVPGAYMVHDQLHIRGGHQVSWLLDGVPVPNTNIASNVGPQFDPKDIDYMEVQRGGLSAQYGDRAYGVLNVVTRSGFERNNEGELVASYGNFDTTNDQISFGSHTERFAYYASLNGNRSDLGLETPTPGVLHDSVGGLGGFLSLIFNRTPSDQLRLVTSLRGDHYQVPNTPEDQAAGVRDVEDERDVFVDFSWAHTTKSGNLLTISPFFHFNRAHYIGGPNDPIIPDDNRASTYAGGVATYAVQQHRHNAHFGIQGFANHDNQAVVLTDTGAGAALSQSNLLWGDLVNVFAEDEFKVSEWLSLNGGLRLTRFSGGLSETAADPRVGAAVRIPRLGWVLHGFYGRYYQAPPLLTVGGPVLDLALAQGFGFLPLQGERDEQYQFGLAVPLKGWMGEVETFRTNARNFFDHDVLGNSNIFFPVTLDHARIHGWEATLRSPQLARRAQLHLAYSHQYVEGSGGVTGGLTDFSPPQAGYYFLDHDQRDTLSLGGQVQLPWHAWSSAALSYGSGFLNGDGPAHLPAHASLDISLGKSISDKLSVQFTALNLTDSRYLLDNSNTFGGTHYVNPREVAVQVKYRFKY